MQSMSILKSDLSFLFPIKQMSHRTFGRQIDRQTVRQMNELSDQFTNLIQTRIFKIFNQSSQGFDESLKLTFRLIDVRFLKFTAEIQLFTLLYVNIFDLQYITNMKII